MVDWLSRLTTIIIFIPGFLSTETLEVKEKAQRPSKKYESKSATTWLTLFCIIQLCNLCIHYYPFHFELCWSKKERFWAFTFAFIFWIFEKEEEKEGIIIIIYWEGPPASLLRRKTTSEERNTSPATTLPLLSKNFCVSIRQESRKKLGKSKVMILISAKEGSRVP